MPVRPGPIPLPFPVFFGVGSSSSTCSASSASERVAALDGLRGLAILAYACHNLYAGPVSTPTESVAWFTLRSGWFGVSLFFVLTGYLTTGRLVDSKRIDPGYRCYFLERALRIVPLYYGFLVLWLLAAARLGPYSAEEVTSLRANQGWYWLFLPNLRLALHDGSFGAEPTIFWSLAVATHFYLLWPLAIARVRSDRLVRLCLALIVAAVLCRLGLCAAGTRPPIAEAIYTATPARMDDLAFGALLALGVRMPGVGPRIARWSPSVACLLSAVLATVFVLDRGLHLDTAFFQTIGYTLVSATAVAYLATALTCRPASPVRQLLQWRPLRACGRWSYGTYVWHGALFYALSRRPWYVHPPPLLGSPLAGALALCFGLVGAGTALGALSWRIYEQPMLRLARPAPSWSRRGTRPAAGSDHTSPR
jgi:peptidoglycan/LPS O-acetylase OafA/YrhL